MLASFVFILQPLGNKVLPKEFRKKDRNEVDPGLMKKFNGKFLLFPCNEAPYRLLNSLMASKSPYNPS